ncbi:MAG: nitroreductase family protein [Candidatus Nealsonbacteria bacterium]
MEVFEAIKIRRSVRSYKAEAVPEGKLKKVLEAARLAPSAHNEQEWKFVVVRDAQKRKELAEAALNQNFIAEAPVVIVAVALDPDHIMSSGVPAFAVDLAIAVDHMTLKATEEGLGTCWIGAFSQEKVKKVLEIPERYKVVVLLPLGFPADTPEPKSRKNIEEIVCYENFSD